MKHDFLDPYFKAARESEARFPAALSDRILSDAASCLAQNTRAATAPKKWTFPKLRLPVLLPSSMAAAIAGLVAAVLLVPGDITPSISEIASLPASASTSEEEEEMLLNAWLHGWTEPAEEDISEDLLVAAYISAQ